MVQKTVRRIGTKAIGTKAIGTKAIGTKVAAKKPARKTASAAKPAAKKAGALSPKVKELIRRQKAGDTLSAIEKAQIARATGTGAKKTARKRKTFVYAPPADFKPFFLDLRFKTGKDGLLTHQVKAERVRGRWDNENAKRFDMMEYDAVTVVALAARLGGLMFASNAEKRLPGNTQYRVILRVNARRGEELSVLVKDIARFEKSAKTGKLRAKWLTDAKDPDRRRLRRAARHLAGAFQTVQLPPSGRQPRKSEDE